MAKPFTITTTGIDEVKKRLDITIEKANVAARSIVLQGSILIANEAKQIFHPRPMGSRRVSKKGKVYFDAKGFGLDGPGYDGSFAPQWPRPTNRSGMLSRSIGKRALVKLGPGRYMSVTGPTMLYGKRVELGGGGARAFPYMQPGFAKAAPALHELYKREWKAALS
jgi:hypothetical protein